MSCHQGQGLSTGHQKVRRAPRRDVVAMNTLPVSVVRFLNELWDAEAEFLSLFMEDMEADGALSESDQEEVRRWFEGDMSTKEEEFAP